MEQTGVKLGIYTQILLYFSEFLANLRSHVSVTKLVQGAK